MASSSQQGECDYEDDRFENVVSGNLRCSICLNVLKEPKMCRRNQHVFCSPCIRRHLQYSSTCPICLEQLTVETLSEVPRLLTDCLSELRIKCDYSSRGCQDFIQLGNIESHVMNCGFAPVRCSNIGCYMEINKRDRVHHETELCDFRKVTCQECGEMRKEIDEVKMSLAEIKERFTQLSSRGEMWKRIDEVKRNQEEMKERLKQLPSLEEDIEGVKAMLGELMKRRDNREDERTSTSLLPGKLDEINKQDRAEAKDLPKDSHSLQKHLRDSKRVSNRRKRSDKKDDYSWFKENFLDPKSYMLKEDVRQKLKSFQWLTGAYGITGPNKKIRHAHLYITIERGYLKRQVRSDIRQRFGSEAIKHVELLQEPKNQPTFKPMSGRGRGRRLENGANDRPKPGGGISCVECDQENPLQISEQREFLQPSRGATGTLTLFVPSETNHFALTCCHVGLADDGMSFSLAFQENPVKSFQKCVALSKLAESLMKRKTFHYRSCEDEQPVNDNEEPSGFGKFSRGCFNGCCDLMSIEVHPGLELDCPIRKVNIPDNEKMGEEILKRINDSDKIRVEKEGFGSGSTGGYLVRYEFNYVYEGINLYEKAYLVKADDDGEFLKPSDSGALVFYVGEDEQKYALAYGVSEVNNLHLPELPESHDTSESSDTSESPDTSDSEVIFCDDNTSDNDGADHAGDQSNRGRYYVCLNLNEGLNKLELSQPCFQQCSRRN